uniref:NADH dehydrogenase subunit 6 n=1 Tax=Mesenchytraeus cf. gelidus SL-2017 TaxID=2052679 RepID=A0A286KAX6_9ANNE|nr:NADH dehydrogenase subunit 6 [Mesenchytraeus cf. gelidus SL-2017]
MILSLLILTITATTFTASTAMNPLTMGLLILMMALLISMIFSMSMSSWVALLIFLIYIGGMLVMFSYFVAITPNQNLSMMLVLSMLISSVSALIFMAFMMNMTPPMNLEYTVQTNIMYEKFNIIMLTMLALILLFTMVVVVKVSIHNKGPLRPFIN